MANSITNFIPAIWSKKLQKIFNTICVMANLVNREFEGEISAEGNVVHVRTFGDVTVNNYTRNQGISYSDLTDPMSDMNIDQAKYFAFKLDKLDEKQSNINVLDGYNARAAQAIKEVVDTHLSSHYTDVPAASTLGSSSAPITLTSTNIYNYTTQLAQKLDEANCPPEGRNFVITPKFKQMMLNAPEFIRSTNLGDKTVVDGKIGVIGGFDVHLTTNGPTASGNTPLMAFTKDFISFASQVSEVRKVPIPGYFANGVEGLYLYGSKVFTNTSSSKGCDKTGAVLWAEGV